MHSIIYVGFNKILRDSEAENFIRSLSSNIFKSPDFLSIKKEDEKKNISIQQVRKAIEFVSIKPSFSNIKVVMLYDAQDLSIEAQNALLKTLEEPPASVQFVLSVDNVSNLLDTVVSRCKVIKVSSSNSVIGQNSTDYESVVKLISMSVGERVDWAMNNRAELNSKDFVVGMFEVWMNELQKEIESHANVNHVEILKNYARLVDILIEYKEDIRKYNVSSLLCVEAFLVNI